MATRQEKEKEKKGIMYVYKLDTGRNLIQQSDHSSINPKKSNSRGGWGLRRSNTVREGVKDVTVEARKSTSIEARNSVSRLQVNVESAAAYVDAKVLATDMPAYMQVHAFRCARRTYDTLETFSSKQLAYSMKKEFDKVYGPSWHCIVGSSFGSFVTHSTGCFLYFSLEKLYILVFRTKIQKILDS